jgi:PAS domain S-box-containing protein
MNRRTSASLLIFRSLPSRAVLFVGIVCLALATLEGWREWTSYNADLDEAEMQSFNLAKSLAQHADDTFEIADTVLVGMVERVETDGTSPAALARLGRLLADRVAEQPRLSNLFIYDEDGRWLANSLPQQPVSLNNSDRAYFQHHKSSSDRKPHLGPPIQSRSTGQWVVTVSRRLNHPDGSFAGVVLATLDVSFFSEFYRRFNVGEQGTIVLVQEAGPTLARFPHEDGLVGRDLSKSPLLAELQVKPAGTRRYTSPIDGITRIGGYQRGSRFPVVVLVGVARNEVLADWRREAAVRTGAVGFLILLIAWTGLRLARQVRNRQQAESALAESEANFRLLAENSSDMVSRIGPDGRRRYVSPASLNLLGYPPSALEGTLATDAVFPDDLAAVQEALVDLRSGHLREVTTCFRSIHSDGSLVWLETSVRVAEDRKRGGPTASLPYRATSRPGRCSRRNSSPWPARMG